MNRDPILTLELGLDGTRLKAINRMTMFGPSSNTTRTPALCAVRPEDYRNILREIMRGYISVLYVSEHVNKRISSVNDINQNKFQKKKTVYRNEYTMKHGNLLKLKQTVADTASAISLTVKIYNS